MSGAAPVANAGNIARVARASRPVALLACSPCLTPGHAPAAADPGKPVSNVVRVSSAIRTAGVASAGRAAASAGLHLCPGLADGIFGTATSAAIGLAATGGTRRELAAGTAVTQVDENGRFIAIFCLQQHPHSFKYGTMPWQRVVNIKSCMDLFPSRRSAIDPV
jgi:hypothetical protein